MVCLGGLAGASEPGPAATARHVVIYRENGRFAGWPANHGAWSWGNEVLVGFSRGYDKDRGEFHHIDHDRPEEHLLARSRDGGETWSIERPQPSGALIGTAGMRHGRLPDNAPEAHPRALKTPIDFSRPGFAMTLRMENSNNGASRYSVSYDRGATWNGPFALPLFGKPGVMARTDYIVNGPSDCLLFLTASKANRREGRPFSARTVDGGLTWKFLSFIGPEPTGYAIMPSTVRVGPDELVTTIRRRDGAKAWIEAFTSHDDGRSWSPLSVPEPDTGEGNPPSLLRLPDGRLCLTYGVRAAPFGIFARLSADRGKTWTAAIVLRDDGGANDLGYVRSILRPDGKALAIYYYNDKSSPTRYLAATVFDPGPP